eukprot:CAMPEP_0113444334 /NCGR_PEP_ID=MMETSP0014_2-20120614/2613_1 /TAXON_ID=2857 /ORGANISM="Nitzschia sp." /LENGTH=327 /DNA_ID=CAMNT_0000335343 /DNA_START=9 /DNA_END=992 /DNA_ORIENTATION=- /assembly_acc=CAM_ASM_000159
MAAATSSSSSSSNTQVISSMHKDFINECSFDNYGRRMATCSGDRFVRIWDLSENGDWNLNAEFQGHKGSVSSLSWAHPEYGSLIATAGADGEAKIWEERTNATTPSSRWTSKAQLTEARKALSCVEFSPRHFGLKLASGSVDGCVRIYEAVDVMNLAQWVNSATLPLFGDGLGVTCLSWSTARFEPPTLVAAGSQALVYRYSDASRQWDSVLVLPPPPEGNVWGISWAPNVGRRFHYIAAAEGRQIRIFKLSRGNGGDGSDDGLKLLSTQTIKLPTPCWRVKWNVTGTVLASSGDKGAVQLWKADFEGNFQCVSQIQGDLSKVIMDP